MGGCVANIVKAGLLTPIEAKSQLETAMEMAVLVEIAQLEKNGKILSIIAHLAPLIGLLGTVLGLFKHSQK